MMEFLRPIVVDEPELAVEALGAVPTGGHFFGEPHTLERYATAFYQPMLSNWQNYEAWQEAGAWAPDTCTGSGSPERDAPCYAPVSMAPGLIGLSHPGTG